MLTATRATTPVAWEGAPGWVAGKLAGLEPDQMGVWGRRWRLRLMPEGAKGDWRKGGTVGCPPSHYSAFDGQGFFRSSAKAFAMACCRWAGTWPRSNHSLMALAVTPRARPNALWLIPRRSMSAFNRSMV